MRLPTDTERHAIVGTTGSGKTVFGLWCLSQRNFDRMPFIIVDFKRDEQIAQIPRLEEIDINAKIPKRPGLYVVRPDATDIDAGNVTDFFYRVWERERTGLFLDEGYMIPPRDPGLRTVLTQGRSKRIPIISLSQRPAFVSPFLLSESEFKSVFYLEHPRDIERMNEWMPRVAPNLLPDHESYWYQREGRELLRLRKCPPLDVIMQIFSDRRVRRWWL